MKSGSSYFFLVRLKCGNFETKFQNRFKFSLQFETKKYGHFQLGDLIKIMSSQYSKSEIHYIFTVTLEKNKENWYDATHLQ